eukprot:TRINITY_DN10563_c1_g1_i1.p1 TRINITY_DN10563_c1_g1~~TRINITY_DN10563_c1_g1_i1.p1  ORF type:complete len:262 (+),score=36.41 TRINITY_DN10563_c1_g1_i1:56-787(+)
MLSADELEQMFMCTAEEEDQVNLIENNASSGALEVSGYESGDEEYFGIELYEWGRRPSGLANQRLEDCVRCLVGMFKGTKKEQILKSKLLPTPFTVGCSLQYRTTCGWAEGVLSAIWSSSEVNISLPNGVVLQNVDVNNVRRCIATPAEQVAFSKILSRQIDKIRNSLDSQPGCVRSFVLSMNSSPRKSVVFSSEPDSVIGVLYCSPTKPNPQIEKPLLMSKRRKIDAPSTSLIEIGSTHSSS